jgi:hypothetical protein
MDYFEFDVIKRTAVALCGLDNVPLSLQPDPLRTSLVSITGLPFATPDHETYKVWRNYKRVFGACMLAAEIDGRLICTELCHKLGAPSPNDMAADDYFAHFTRRFYFPSPAFQDYDQRGMQVFPVIAILKFLIAKARRGEKPVAMVDEIIGFVVANNCTGDESAADYDRLAPRRYVPAADEVRQIREFIRFISQMSFFKWVSPRLYLDIAPDDSETLGLLEALAQPFHRTRNPDAARELLHLGTTGVLPVLPLIPTPIVEADISFSEGKPKRVSHLRYERSPKLREMYFRGRRAPFVCDMCALNVSHRYGWVENLLELHHLLPLASPLRIEAQRTSLSQLVPICPNCHKATHAYYRNWLDERGQDDFASYEEAGEVYTLAKNSAVIVN